MRKLYRHIARYNLIYIGLIIHTLFYISAYRTGWFNVFFSGNAIHYCCPGADFYQIPDGAYSYLHGGSLAGAPPSGGRSVYANTIYSVNANVYHPLFTLTVGWLLIQFQPDQAFFVWMLLKLIITLLVTGYFFWSFRGSKYITLAVFVLLANCSQYLEIAIGQFHAVMNAFLLLLLINLVKKQSHIWGGIFYCLSLLVKPIGLLWVWTFICKQRFNVVLLGGLLFGLSTAIFTLSGSGDYYMTNLVYHFLYPVAGKPGQLMTLSDLLTYSLPSWPGIIFKLIEYSVLGIVFFFNSLKRVHMSKGIFLTAVYYLLFYDYVFEYHYTTIATVVAVCLVCCPEFQTRLSRVLILLTCLPSIFVLLNYWHIDVELDSIYGLNPTPLGWQLMVLSKIVPVILLSMVVLASDVASVYSQIKAFPAALRNARG
ncbi:MAG: hypothetical protein J2P36_38460 [Ktedonobacteraceae bacterium]|nr:hypothetical protein [Ktedonobacteraceae bacterium]